MQPARPTILPVPSFRSFCSQASNQEAEFNFMGEIFMNT